MTIQAQLADGRTLEFPDGTDPTVIQATVKKMIGGQQQAAQPTAQQPVQQEQSFADKAIGVTENVGSLVSGAIAEPVAGLAGIAQSLNPFADEGAGAKAVESTREALTYKPRSDAGQSQQQALGELLAPVGEALSESEKFLGENTLKLTGSPALAAMAHSLPTAALELIGVKGSKRLTGAAKEPTKKAIKRAVIESAPEVDQIKAAASAVYKEIDDSGVSVKPDKFALLVNDLEVKTRKAGIDADVTPKAAGAMKRFKSELGNAKTLTDVDTLRKVAQGVAGQLDNTEKALGNIMLGEIDDFLDTLKASDLTKGSQSAADTGKKFKAARKLWGRARRAELLQDAITTGESRAAGAEAGIRNEFNRILNNKKLSRFIPVDEQAAMRKVVDGNFAQNMTRLIGKVGLSVDRSPNVFGSIIAGGGLGTVVGGGTGAVIVPVVGTISKQIAKKLTTNKANFVEAITRAGSDGERITKAYLSAVPKAKRRVQDLADLLTDPKINIAELEAIADGTIQDALDIAKGRRAINLAAGAVAGSLGQAVKEETQK